MWTCHSTVPASPGHPARTFDTRWEIAPAPGNAWTIVRWGDQSSANGGVAYVGYIAPEHHWVYQDFHYDGSYAIQNSPGPNNGTWTWGPGTFYTATGALHGTVDWSLVSPTRIDRRFTQLIDGKPAHVGTDYCTKK